MTGSRNFRDGRVLALALGCAVLSGGALAATLGGPLHLADEGMFFVDVESAPAPSNAPTSTVPGGPSSAVPGHVVVKKTYVHFRIPEKISGLPVIMIGGSGDTGTTYETTPDNREGWATYFARNGFPVYVVDGPGRGRSGFNTLPIMRAKREGKPELIPDLNVNTLESSWTGLRIGPKYPERFPGSQFPEEGVEQFAAQFVANSESTLGTPTEAREATIDALVALLDKTGPAILIVHSQSGLYGLTAMTRRPDLVKAIISTEGSCVAVTEAEKQTTPQDAIEKQLLKTPFLEIFGDNTERFPDSWNGTKRIGACREVIGRVRAGGGPSTLFVLPEHGFIGNSHALALEKNNLLIADRVFQWIEETVK